MKRTLLVAIMVMALVFGAVAYANALTENVDVTATINPAFSMTLDSNTFTYGLVDVGTTPSIAGPEITIKSNKLYSYTEAAVTCTEPLLEPLSSQSYVDVAGPGIGARGASTIQYTYDLDLTSDAAYEIPAETLMTLTYGYTALQL